MTVLCLFIAGDWVAPRKYAMGGIIIRKEKKCCAKKWCVTDGCGITCGILTWFLMFYGQFCVLTIMSVSAEDNFYHQLLNFILFETFFILAFSSHFQTMFTDPGAVPKGTLTDDYVAKVERENGHTTVIYKCTKCACVRPERAHHCSVCQRCIKRMDHHCPWVNNCVGENNQKCFVLFTFYVALLSCQTLYWAVWQFVQCVNKDWRNCSYFNPPTTTILLIFLLFEAILFSIFTAVMFGTQMSAICSDQTGIESLKNEDRGRTDPNSWKKNLQVVFGGPFSVKWLNPFAIPLISEKAFEFSV
uniref:Palmitoyltransferase n=1 Tax=Ditylenchus dipsaci TaxID=166011 RepID=A0A915E4W9_9BILA